MLLEASAGVLSRKTAERRCTRRNRNDSTVVGMKTRSDVIRPTMMRRLIESIDTMEASSNW